jgi:glycosyltransferase involved in cell wall biosynthesis
MTEDATSSLERARPSAGPAPGSIPVSVVIIARDEAARIGRCLASVAFARERIVLDGGSRDDTVALSRSLGARVEVAADWPGFGAQKNRAVDLAREPWVLSLDADEWVDPDLAREIAQVVSDPRSADVYDIPRRSSYCGRVMRHSGWWPDPVTRLWRRGRARFSHHVVHERLLPVEASARPLPRLRHALDHEAFTSLEQVIAKMDRYSTDSAAMLAASGRRGSLGTALMHGAWSFVRTWLLRGGFLDGRQGLMLAISNAEGSYYRYLKLMLLREAADGRAEPSGHGPAPRDWPRRPPPGGP